MAVLLNYTNLSKCGWQYANFLREIMSSYRCNSTNRDLNRRKNKKPESVTAK